MSESSVGNIIVVLGNQLSHDLAALREGSIDRDVVLMVEVRSIAERHPYHKKKLAFVFSAMRHFAAELEADGWTVRYVRYGDSQNRESISREIQRAVDALVPARVTVTEPGSWRMRRTLQGLPDLLGVPVEILEDDRFLCSHEEFEAWADGRRQLRMEYFYREMRRKTGLLMDGDQPCEDRWNFDAENRKPPAKDARFPEPPRFLPDALTEEVFGLVEKRFGDHFGSLEPFWFAVTRHNAEKALDAFVNNALPRFGDFQDAMVERSGFLFHSALSQYINAGLLDPLAVCRRVEAAYRAGHAPINAAEGFIRQVIGWREFVRGIYWRRMPGYLDENHLEHKRPLPDFYWTGDTEMACMRAAIGQTRDEACAHHIQRLMVTGNFALIAGIDPKAVHEWYLSVYADAYEWVEAPNSMGMSQFADGGVLASKPYAASGNYINRMSDYCGSCRYRVKEKTGKAACPFNYLYWHFLHRNRPTLGANGRLRNSYRMWDRFDPEHRENLLTDAERFLEHLG